MTITDTHSSSSLKTKANRRTLPTLHDRYGIWTEAVVNGIKAWL